MEQTAFLQELGLSAKECLIYQLLLKLGQGKARDILKHADMPRGTVYEILTQLKEKGLIEETSDASNITIFRCKHPFALRELISDQKQKLDQNEAKLESIFPDFMALFHQSQRRPGVIFYEGKEGIWKALKDTLTSKTEILTILDIALITGVYRELNEKYVKMRNAQHIMKRLLVSDTPEARQRYTNSRELLTTRLVKIPMNFGTSMHIYDNKVSYITATDSFMTATIIQDERVFMMSKAIFDFLWSP